MFYQQQINGVSNSYGDGVTVSSDNYIGNPQAITAENLLTDGILIFFFLIKQYWGFKIAKGQLFPPAKEYEYYFLGDEDELKWRTQKVKRLRYDTHWFYLVSIVTYAFQLVQTLVIVYTFWNSAITYSRAIVVLLAAFIQLTYFRHKIGLYLDELDEEVRKRFLVYRRISKINR